MNFIDCNDLKVAGVQQCDQINTDQTGHVLVCVAMNPKKRIVTCTGEAFLKFEVLEEDCDPY